MSLATLLRIGLPFVTGWGLATASLAADLPSAGSPPVLPSVAPAWSGFYAHIGGTGLFLDVGAKIRAAGRPVSGANLSIAPQAAASVEIGYHLTPNWAVSVVGGVPPTFDFVGAGAIAGLGKLGSTTAGPLAVTAHYHFLQFGAFQPYIGAGPGYLVVFGSKDAAQSHLHVNSAFAAVGQIGADFMMTEHVGLFIDLKKAYLRTTASGLLGATPTKAAIKLDPLALTGGVTIRF